MSVRLKKRVPRKKANMFSFMRNPPPGPKSDQELYNHAMQFLSHGQGTPKEAVEMLEDDFGVDHKKAVGMVRSIVRRLGSRKVQARSEHLEDTKMATRSRRTAKMDIMTGFTGKEPPDLDLGLDGNSYFEKWTTLSLPDTGKNSALDDDEQPSGGGAPATVIPGAPLKTPMEAQDVTRPKLRESPEASRRKAGVLRKVASEIRLLDPMTARRLMAAADELSYDALSTASLPEAGDESNEVDDYQDNLGHGTLQFFGTDPAKSTSLTRESSRRRRASEDFTRCEISYKHDGGNWEKEVCTSKDEYDKKMKELKKDGAEIKVRHFDSGDRETNLQYANRGASRRRAAGEGPSRRKLFIRPVYDRNERPLSLAVCKTNGPITVDEQIVEHYPFHTPGRDIKQDFPEYEMDWGDVINEGGGGGGARPRRPRGASRRRSAGEQASPQGLKGNVDWTRTLGFVDHALQGKYDPRAVKSLLDSDYKRTVDLLSRGQNGQGGQGSQSSVTPAQPAQKAASRRRAGPVGMQPAPGAGSVNPAVEGLANKYPGVPMSVINGLAQRVRDPSMLEREVRNISLDRMRNPMGWQQRARTQSRRARTQGDAPLKPEPTVGDQDGPGADGAGGFYRESKAPLQETMTAQDVDRPKLRENPEAGRLASLWDAFKTELVRQASGGGKWNSGRYAIEARDYGDSVEIQASVVDRENLPMPVGSILFSRISDSPRGRYATVEVNDGILENRTTEFTLQRPRQAGVIVRRLVARVVQSSKDVIDGITV
jgi:hypothetical protein